MIVGGWTYKKFQNIGMHPRIIFPFFLLSFFLLFFFYVTNTRVRGSSE
jgi:hypothetical protein